MNTTFLQACPSTIQLSLVITFFLTGSQLYSQSDGAEDPYQRQGNVKPRIVTLSAEEEAAILKDVRVPPEFEMSLFAPSATANYPVYVAAAPNGDLYVSSDGNGSLGRDPNRGRVLRLRDQDGDGRADQVTEFIPNIDSPRGLIWDHDRLYLLHPPHVSVHFDRDGDGVAEDAALLIERIAFGFKDRPADHTTNGLELGIDGWIYIAGGDFGFLEALGTDGRRLQHHGGGVIRFRPDGSGLELFATGTRNILGTPMSPLLDLFARDNTNDGGGWDVRLHHFSGLEDHGYPRLYKNFPSEHIHQLADYGGGSGCGSVYLHEPGFPKDWGPAPFTCDWGRAALFRHPVQRQGASFIETASPKEFIRMTRPTDADVDGLSQVYQASWKGPATFNWNGPDVGYIVKVRPKGFTPDPLPDFETLSDSELVTLLGSPSHIRTLNAQRALLRRRELKSTTELLLNFASTSSTPLRSRVAALYAVSQRGIPSQHSERIIQLLTPLTHDPELRPFVIRALGDMGLDQLTKGHPGPTPAIWFNAGLLDADPRTRVEAMVAAARQRRSASADAIASNLGHEDPRIAHTAFRALAALDASDACFQVLDATGSSDAQRMGAAHALMRMHRSDVVDNLIGRLQAGQPPHDPTPLLSALARLYHREADWTGESWGTRPDTRGPYYQLESWEQSSKILGALHDMLRTTSPNQAAVLVEEMNRNRIRSAPALERIIGLALQDAQHTTTAIAQLAAAKSIPTQATSLILRAAQTEDIAPMTSAQLVQCLAKTIHPDALTALLNVLARLDKVQGAGKAQQTARMAFLGNPQLENWHHALVRIINEQPAAEASRWAFAALLTLASGKNTNPEPKAAAMQAIAQAWEDGPQRIRLMALAASMRNHYLDDRIRVSIHDLDSEIAQAAKNAARRLRIPAPGKDQTPKIDTLTVASALEQATLTQGDRFLGEAIFARAACATCHTVNQDQAPKGPYLGNIANTYRRKELAESILEPSKTIAQGFATHVILLRDGTEYTGFVTLEAGDQVALRDIAGQEHVIKKPEIADRKTTSQSIMPPGLMNAFSVHEFASLLDYLESLVPKP